MAGSKDLIILFPNNTEKLKCTAAEYVWSISLSRYYN